MFAPIDQTRVDDIYEASRIDMWFLEQIKGIVDTEKKVREFGLPDRADALRGLKSMGFSDKRLAELAVQEQRDRSSHFFPLTFPLAAAHSTAVADHRTVACKRQIGTDRSPRLMAQVGPY